MADELKILSSELGHYEATDRTGHYLKAFKGDHESNDLTLLVRDDQWETSGDRDYIAYRSSAVSITRQDALALANWVLERFVV